MGAVFRAEIRKKNTEKIKIRYIGKRRGEKGRSGKREKERKKKKRA